MAQAKFKTILYEKDKEEPAILYVTLNRPEKTNAISIGPDGVTGEIKQACTLANLDPEVKVVVFKASGDNFSAGFDLSMVYRVYGGAPGVRPQQSTRLQVDDDHIMGMPRAVLACNKVTIAQVQGWCIEAGIFIVESSDIAVAAKNAKFAHRGQRLAFGGQAFMPLELFEGHNKKITEMLITGRTISGEEAEQIGIVTRAVEPEILADEVHNLAKAICNYPLDAIVMGKMHRRLIYESLAMNSVFSEIAFHTLSTNLQYGPNEKDNVFIRDRERMGAKAAFHKLHDAFETHLNKTRYFRSYRG